MNGATAAGRVVHWVGPLAVPGTREGLWPAVLALAGAGVAQCVALREEGDTAEARLMLPRSVRIVTVAHGGLRARPWSRPSTPPPGGLLALLTERPLLALHLHGPAVLAGGLRALRRLEAPTPVFLHASAPAGSISPWPRLRALRPPRLPALQAYRVQAGRVVAVSDRPLRLPDLPDLPGSPSSEGLLHLARAEAARPRVVTHGRPDDLALARAFAQLAVLFAGAEPALDFAWLGAADPPVLAVLQAARVELLPDRDSADRAAALGRAWLHLSLRGDAADAPGLIEAMSAALPCVVQDHPACRPLVVDRLSGWLCAEPADTLRAIAQLVDSRPLRQAIGQAARLRSEQRHGHDRFRASLLLAHGLALPAAQAEAEKIESSDARAHRPLSRSLPRHGP
jgi:Glycosyl transferases group 1